MPHEAEVAEMLRKDLADARCEWLRASQDNPDEHARRQENDFLVPVNHEGEVLDFHALRHTCGTWLAMSGAHPKAVQAVMRHSTITLTMDTYGHLFPGQEADTVARLPAMLTDPPEALRATGTVDATFAARGWAQNGAQLNGKTCAPLASGGENTTARSGEPDCRNPLPASIFGNPRRAVAAADEARPAGLEPATCGLEVGGQESASSYTPKRCVGANTRGAASGAVEFALKNGPLGRRHRSSHARHGRRIAS